MGEAEQLNLANKLIIDIKDITKKNLPITGNKATNLARLMSSGFNVPDGFCLTTEAYQQTLGLEHKDQVLKVLVKNIDLNQPDKIKKTSRSIAEMFDRISISEKIAGQIKSKYQNPF